jgi:hypothetical protein
MSYPNPFIGTTTLDYSLPADGEVTIEIHDLLGITVKNVLDRTPQRSGSYKLVLDGNDLADGIYVATLRLTTKGGQPMMRTIKIVRTF